MCTYAAGLEIGEFSPVEDVPYITRNGIPFPTDYSASGRKIISLDGKWKFSNSARENNPAAPVDARNIDTSDWRDIDVPGTWDTALGDELLHFKGDGWYALEFNFDRKNLKGFTKLVFRGSFLETDVYLNNKYLGKSRSGYSPFYFDAGDALVDGKNVIVAVVNNQIKYDTIPINTYLKKDLHGWWPYGGIHRSVYLELGNSQLSVFRADIRTDISGNFTSAAFSADVSIYNSSTETVGGKKLKAHILDPDHRIVYSFQPMPMEIDGGSVRSFNLSGTLAAVKLWDTVSPENIYTLSVTISNFDSDSPEDEVSYQFGFRKFEIRGTEIFLNGRKHFLYGINRHEDSPGSGLHQTEERLAEDLSLIRELNVNHIRTGHYPADSRFLKMLRDSGITITEEVPIYQLSGDQMSDPEIIGECRRQLAEMIERDRNNPAIITWSLANEIIVYHAAAAPFVQALNDEAKRLDPERFTTVEIPALELFTGGDYVSPIVDIVSINEYFGWYYGENRGLSPYLDKVHKATPDKPMIVSEFGAGTLIGRHIDEVIPEANDDHSYSEEFQSAFYNDHFRIIFSKDYVVGTMPWVFSDFRMEWIQSTGKPHPVQEMNLKGLLSWDREKKAAFDIVRTFYAKHRDRFGFR